MLRTVNIATALQSLPVDGMPASRDDAPTTVLIGGDTLLREGLKRVLVDAEFGVAGDSQTIVEAFGRFEQRAPQMVLLLVGTVDVERVEPAVDEIQAEWPGARIVLLGDVANADDLAALMRAGIDGVLTQAMSPQALVHSLRLVALGENVFPARIALRPVVDADDVDEPARCHGLSRRDVAILECLTEGYSNRMIARHLKSSDATVKSQLRTLLGKLGLSNRTQAALWALEHRLGRARHEEGGH